MCDLLDKLDRSSSASASTDVGAAFSEFRESFWPGTKVDEVIERQSASDPLEEFGRIRLFAAGSAS